MSFECVQIKQEPAPESPSTSNNIVNNYENSAQFSENINNVHDIAVNLSKTNFISIKIEPQNTENW